MSVYVSVSISTFNNMPLANAGIGNRYRHPVTDTDMWMSVLGTVGIKYHLVP